MNQFSASPKQQQFFNIIGLGVCLICQYRLPRKSWYMIIMIIEIIFYSLIIIITNNLLIIYSLLLAFILFWLIYCPNTAWKVSKYGVFSGPYFPVFGLNTEIYGVNFCWADHIPWNFLKAVCYKIYLEHSWILCPK